jgi:hypothetical protein
MFAADNVVVVGFVPMYKSERPVTAVPTAKKKAPRREMSPRTRGRLRVRDMSASYFGSNIMFSVLALQHDKNVPTVK